jgi:hypothetical protein
MSDEDFQNLDYISLFENVKPKSSNDKRGKEFWIGISLQMDCV